LVRLVAGELSQAEKGDIEVHVARCPSCSERLEELQATWRVMGTWHVKATGHDVTDGVLTAIESAPVRWPPVRWFPPWLWPVPIRAAASIVLAAGIGWMAGRWVPAGSQQVRPGPAPVVEPVSVDLVARDMSFDEMTGGAPTGLAITLLTDEPETSEQEEKG